MEDSPKQAIESISQQPKFENKQELTPSTSGHQPKTRKQRGIFTATNSTSVRVNHPNGPWPIQNSHMPGLETGDNAQVSNLRNQYMHRESAASPSTDGAEINIQSTSPVNNTTQENEMAENNLEEPSLVEDVEGLIGNYHVNPLDGSLIKILTIQPIDGPSRDESEIELRKGLSPTNFSNNGQTDQPSLGRRKYRKRKFRETTSYYDDEEYLPTNVKQATGIPKPTGNKAEEVLKAAKSLFSKRTRTLYHWLYPSTSKLELKNIVVSAWDTLQESEKHFYISQVLGRFGFPASNLMVNPQIGGLQGMPTDHLRGNTSVALAASSIPGSSSSESAHDTTKRVVEELLANENDLDWNITKSNKFAYDRRKRRKYASSKSSPGSDSGQGGETILGLTGVDDDVPSKIIDEDFQNDPELSKEIAAYKLNTGESEEELSQHQLV